jgi:hypothetical protein
MWGAFRDWNTLMRFVSDGVQDGEISHPHKDAIISWISFTTNNNTSIILPARREKLTRFGGALSDEEYNGQYTSFAVGAISVGEDMLMREIERETKKEKSANNPPSLGQAMKELMVPKQVTLFHVAAISPTNFWLQRTGVSSCDTLVNEVGKYAQSIGGEHAGAFGHSALTLPAYFGPTKPTTAVKAIFGVKRTAAGKNKARLGNSAPASAPVAKKLGASRKVAKVTNE